METPSPKCCTEFIFPPGALAEPRAEYKMLECSLSFSIPKVFFLTRFSPVLMIIFYIFQWFFPPVTIFPGQNALCGRSQVIWGQMLCFFSQLKKDAKCCHSPLTMSQPLHACGRRAEKEEFVDFCFWDIHIFGVYILNHF